jgi:hypothetical protein
MIEQKGRPLYDFLIVKATPYLREQRTKVVNGRTRVP